MKKPKVKNLNITEAARALAALSRGKTSKRKAISSALNGASGGPKSIGSVLWFGEWRLEKVSRNGWEVRRANVRGPVKFEGSLKECRDWCALR